MPPWWGMTPLALITACVLDLVVGDPRGWPHPVVLMGRFISVLHNQARAAARTPGARRAAGIGITVVVVLLSYGSTFLLIRGAEGLHASLGWAVAVYLAYTTLAARSLQREASRVAATLRQGRIEAARKHLAGIVGRDTDRLSEQEVIRAAVETVSENTSDGVIAPLFYLALGGPPLAMAYKAVNTLDSMLGYRQEPYRDLGWFPARLDDAANFLPARITGLLMVLCAPFLRLSPQGALRTMWRDGGKHTSPNAGIPEAAAAGALGVRLGGTNLYFGVPSRKPYIGEGRRALSIESIQGAVALMYGVFFLMVLVSVLWGFLF